MKLGKWGGINVYIHWTFWLLIGFYLITVSLQSGPLQGLIVAALVLSVFVCVALHEFGHAAAAAYYGIRTLDITLLPIGGVARLQRLPEKPVQELVIALAGPAVNFAIAGLMLPLLLLGWAAIETPVAAGRPLSFGTQLFAANLVLALFNLLPAFPMDGGRVLRSLLAMRMGHLRATEIAARGGRWMALLFAMFGFYYFSITLILLALFVFIAGTAELVAAKVRAMGDELAGQGYPAGTTFPGSFQVWQTTAWPPTNSPSYRDLGSANEIIDGEVIDSEVVDRVEVRRLRHDPFSSPGTD